MNKQTVYQIDVNNKKVIVRADLNVPHKDGKINDDNRIVQALDTLKYLIENNAKVIVMSHLGKVKHSDPEKAAKQIKDNNLDIVAKRMSELLNKEVVFVNETKGEKLEKAINKLKGGDILLVQNTRYEKGEEKNDQALGTYWASLCDVYVEDAFGSCHRAHASTYGVPSICKENNKPTAIGYLVEREVKSLNKCVEAKEHPYIAVMGGSKVSDKIKVIEGLMKKADKILIGGAMAFTFMKALDKEIGKSLVELDQVDFAKKCLAKGKIYLPLDYVVADSLENPTNVGVTEDRNVPVNQMGLDIGPKTIKYYKEELKGAKIVFWNGPMGASEFGEDFAKGTKGICEMLANMDDCFTVIGGGDSASAAKDLGYFEKFNHVSTGGGASLEMIENDGHLPGIDVIEDK